jgi:hypothetical protein
MIMADVLKIFLLVVGALMVLVCYWLCSEALFPRMVERSRRHYSCHPIKITLLGALLGIPPVILGLAIMNGVGGHPLGQMIGGGLILVTLLAGILGSTGLSRQIGCGLPSPVDEGQPWRRVLRGGVVLSFTFLLPFLGWFVLTAWTVVSGFGAFVASLYEARRIETSSAPPRPNIEPAAA